MAQFINQDVTMESLAKIRARNKREVLSFQTNSELSTQYEFIGNLFSNTKNFLTNSLTSIGSWFTELQNTTPDPLPQFYNASKSGKIIADFCKHNENYMNYGLVDVQYIIGCKESIKTIGDKLVSIPKNHIAIVDGILDDCDTFISKVISSEDFRMSNTPIVPTAKVKEGIKFTEEIDKLHNFLIDPSSFEESRQLQSICGNLAELNSSTDYINKLQATLNKKALDEILDKVESLSVKTRTLANDITTDSLQCTQAIVNGIKTHIGYAANAVTALSTYYYLVSQYALVYNALANTISNLK